MRNLVSAIIIDADKDKHNYSLVKTNKLYDIAEDKLDIIVFKDDSDILKKINDFKGVDAIVTIGDVVLNELPKMQFDIRKKWIHIDEFQPNVIAERIMWVLLGNLNRENPDDNKLFSIFTCAFNTKESDFMRLYNSLKNQTYTNWDWYILDDSTTDGVEKMVKSLNDPRIVMIKNVTNHGNIGFNKHTIAMMCDGDYLVEVDHDDELTEDCLFYLHKAFMTYPDTDFVYSDAMEVMNGGAINYGESWCCGEGVSKYEEVKGKMEFVSKTPNITAMTIRSIHSQPNHVRCWDKKFYHSINGHNTALSVLDDMDILVRTFLHGKMTKVDKVLYIQYEGEGERGKDAKSAQSVRFAEIQRTDEYLHWKYDSDIHKRILELGEEDTVWNEKESRSILWTEHKISNNMNNILKV